MSPETNKRGLITDTSLFLPSGTRDFPPGPNNCERCMQSVGGAPGDQGGHS